MKLFGLEISRKSQGGAVQGDIDAILRRLHSVYETVSGIVVTPETCMDSSTVQAIVQAVTRRISTLPIQVLRKGTRNGRSTKTPVPEHPVSKLLNAPNRAQTSVNYWQDNVSWLLRYGYFANYKAKGKTGPTRLLLPMHPGSTCIELEDDNWDLKFRFKSERGVSIDYTSQEVFFARGPSRDGWSPVSPVKDIREAIALEIAAEKFGSSFFGNGAMPLMIFKFIQGIKGFKTDEDKKEFVRDFQEQYAGSRRFKMMVLPVGMEHADVKVENDKAQFLDTRKYQRTVISAAWGVPPHLVGDLERATFNNVEQQGIDFIVSVVLPYVRIIEAAMERDLLTDEDRSGGIIVRFNLEAALRGDFKSRQEGLQIQKRNGIINSNEWREHENMNPLSKEEGGEEYIREGNLVPSTPGSTQVTAPPPVEPEPAKKDFYDRLTAYTRELISDAKDINTRDRN